MIYMEDSHLEIIRNILKKYDYSFYAFGSRVKGTQKPLSDFDLVFMDNMKLGDKLNIDNDFEESDLPFKVDVVNYQTISDDFKEIIRADLEIFQISSSHQPHPDIAYPILDTDGYARKACCFLKNIIKNKQYINIGDYTYYHDIEDVNNFEKNVLYHRGEIIGDKLIIGKFCQIAQGVKFMMNLSQHPMNGISGYPFKLFSGNHLSKSIKCDDKLLWDIPFYMQVKGDTIVGNDVWIGYNATIMPGIKIGDGAVIATNSTVTKNVDPYTIVGGSPAKVIRKKFDDQTIEKLLKLKWWDMDIGKINEYIKDIGLDIKESRLIRPI